MVAVAALQYALVRLTGVSGCTRASTENIKGVKICLFNSICHRFIALCPVMSPVVYGQLLPGNHTQLDVLQGGRERGLVEGDCDLLLVSVDVFDCSCGESTEFRGLDLLQAEIRSINKVKWFVRHLRGFD